MNSFWFTQINLPALCYSYILNSFKHTELNILGYYFNSEIIDISQKKNSHEMLFSSQILIIDTIYSKL